MIKKPLELLSRREYQVFELVNEGLTTRTIAERLDIKMNTVRHYRKVVRRKLGMVK